MQHLTPKRIFYLNTVARVITCRASALLSSGFSRANLFLVQETQPAKDIDLTCFKTFPIKAATCLQVGAMSLDWPVDPCARFDHSRSSLSLSLLRFPATINGETLFQLPDVPVGNRILFKHHRKYYSVLQVGMGVAPSFLKACDVLLGTPGVW